MLAAQKYSTLHTAYQGYFDDVVPASAHALPLLGAQGPLGTAEPSGELVQSALTQATQQMMRQFSPAAYIMLTPLEFGILCLAAGIVVGLVVGYSVRGKR
jgi:hypothetical protein